MTEDAPTEAVEADAEPPVEAAAKGSVEAPVEGSVEAPVEGSVEAAAEAPVEAAAEAPVEAAAEAPVEAAAEAPVEPWVVPPEEPPAEETRASRRARRGQAATPTPELAEAPASGRFVIVGVTLLFAALMLFGVRTDEAVFATTLGWVGAVLAWGWGWLVGSPTQIVTSAIVMAAGVGMPALAQLSGSPQSLRPLAPALAGVLFLTFLHQLFRRDGRARLTESITTTLAGVALVVCGLTMLGLASSARGAHLVTAAVAAAGVGVLADLLALKDLWRRWLLPLAMALGGVAAGIVHGVLGSGQLAQDVLLGLLAAAAGHAVRRALETLPGIGHRRAQLSTAAAGLLIPGPLVYLLVRFFGA